ncbi:MAG: sugar phosphate isomerase/epimerase family protein [Planctomycetota bacterium]|jgi:hexulose-6-phosphate isomerase
MKYRLNRRDFLGASAAAGVGCVISRTTATNRRLRAATLQAAPFKTKLHKALIGKPTEETLASWKAAGFEGIESNAWNVSPKEAAAARRVAEKLEMRIHSVLYGWANFNSKDSVAKDLADVTTALRACRGYGADALLLVPCRIGGIPTPKPWEFDIEFEEKTGHVERVVAGDNSQYAGYIEAHNHAVDTSRKAVEKLIPVAEKTKVIIALENVWNNLWVKPAIFQNFIASFDNPWVQCYYDIGNHVNYAPPEEWIRTLGKLIVECHVKDFRMYADRRDGTVDWSQVKNDLGEINPRTRRGIEQRGGVFTNIREGSVNWPLIRKELDKIGYNGWMTIEGSGGLSLEERNKRLDLIIAGK